MTPIETIAELKKLYTSKELNEADTRFKIIDVIIEKILTWPRTPIFLEVITKGTRADYVLKNKLNKAVLIIESKKAGKYFELPVNINSSNNYQKVLVEKLLSDKNIKDAMFQVKEYCEDLGCNFGCISNGFTWIVFNVNSTYGPWKKQPAFVIRDLDFFSENFIIATNIFSYHNVVNRSSLKYNIGITREIHSEVFYPKSSITAYDMPVNSNHYAGILNSIGRKYLSNIPLDDKEFFDKCYVTNKGYYDDLQKNVQGVIYDSLTPFFKSEGVVDIHDNNQGGGFAIKVEQVIKRENLDNVMILFGGRGSGKSTFLRRLLLHLKPKPITQYGEVCIVDLINSAQIPEQLSTEIWEKVRIEIDKKNLLGGSKEELKGLFKDRYEKFERQVLSGLDIHSVEYQKLLNEFIRDCLNDTKYCCQVLSNYWKSQKKGLIIVLDNMDQLRQELQDVSFLNSIEIAKKLSCLVVISMREERYYNAKSKGVLDAYHVPGFHINSPVIPDVVIKRLRFIIAKATSEKIGSEIEFKSQKQLDVVISFLQICTNEIARTNSDLSKFLRYSTHGDVRQALNFFKGFITSGYTNINEMAPHPTWRFQMHQVIKPMMTPNRFFYDEKNSQIPNIFQLRNETKSSHFCGLRVLAKLHQRSFDKASAGFMDIKFLLQTFDSLYDLKEDCIKHLDIFLTKGVVESNNRLEEFNDDVDQIRITSFGKYILDFLTFDFTYIDLVSLDCGIYDEALNNYMIKTAEKEVELYDRKRFKDRVISRLERVLKFIEYLEIQENKEFDDLSLPDTESKFVPKLKQKFSEQTAQIKKSLQNRDDSSFDYKIINN